MVIPADFGSSAGKANPRPSSGKVAELAKYRVKRVTPAGPVDHAIGHDPAVERSDQLRGQTPQNRNDQTLFDKQISPMTRNPRNSRF